MCVSNKACMVRINTTMSTLRTLECQLRLTILLQQWDELRL